MARPATARRSSAPSTCVAIAPMQSPSSLYHDVVFPGGIKSTERGEIDNWPDIANLTTEGVVDADAEFAANREHPTFDGFWRDRSFVGCLDDALDPGARDRWLERRLLPVRHPRQHRGACPGARGRCTARGSTSSRSRSSTSRRGRPGPRTTSRRTCAAETPADGAGRAAGVVRPLGRGDARRPGPARADLHVVRGPGRGRRRMARARSLGPDRECGRRAPARRWRHARGDRRRGRDGDHPPAGRARTSPWTW